MEEKKPFPEPGTSNAVANLPVRVKEKPVFELIPVLSIKKEYKEIKQEPLLQIAPVLAIKKEYEVASELYGFTVDEINAAVTHARVIQKEIETKCKLHGFNVPLLESFEKELATIGLNADTQYISSLPKGVISRTSKQCFDGGGGDGSGIARLRKTVSTSKISSSNIHVGTNSNLKHHVAKKLLPRAKRSSSHIVATPKKYQEKGVCCAIGKFVLPSRSAHSSRVIKPNKRFIDEDEVTSDVSVVRSPIAILPKKPKLILSPLKNLVDYLECSYDSCELSASVSDETNDKDKYFNSNTLNVFDHTSSGITNNRTNTSSPNDSRDLVVTGKRRWKPSYKVQLKLRELNVSAKFPFRWNLVSRTASDSIHSSSDRDTNSQSTSSNTADERSESEGFVSANNAVTNDKEERLPSSGPKLNGSKVILREARLKLDSLASSISDELFSSMGHEGMSGMVECGVCGAVRFYRFVKQARKFGIASCESCRKFISKMIKQQKLGMPALDCRKGKGCCSIPPIIRSQQWRTGRGASLRCNYKARCPACWLKICLRSFHMPEQLSHSLSFMLPLEMRNGCMLSPLEPIPNGQTKCIRKSEGRGACEEMAYEET